MVSCSTPAELDAGEKPAIKQAGLTGSKQERLLSSGNPAKVGEVEMGTIGGAGTCSRKAQHGAAKLEGWNRDPESRRER